jgi:hypothetical protein
MILPDWRTQWKRGGRGWASEHGDTIALFEDGWYLTLNACPTMGRKYGPFADVRRAKLFVEDIRGGGLVNHGLYAARSMEGRWGWVCIRAGFWVRERKGGVCSVERIGSKWFAHPSDHDFKFTGGPFFTAQMAKAICEGVSWRGFYTRKP